MYTPTAAVIFTVIQPIEYRRALGIREMNNNR